MADVALGRPAVEIAEALVREQVMPSPSNAGGALHVAMAVANGMDYILTWNVKHLANPNKRTHFEVFCKRLGYSAPQLVTPDLLKVSVDDE
ncbi:MAG TPA: hypothetical protein VHQ47_20805 [Phycisphaerae bacterium]|nr:hypothetical protein [Phycisphaerae bacterium]